MAVNATATSNSIVLAGAGSRSVRATCSGCTLEINGSGTFSGSISGVKSGDSIRIRLTASSSGGATVTGSVTVGTTASGVWSVTTAVQDTTPDAYSIAGLTIQPLSTQVTSGAVTPTGYDAATSIAVSGAGSPQVSVNYGGWTTSTTINSGQNFRVQMTTSATTATSNVATVTIGGVSATWTVSTYSTLGPNLFANGGAESGDLTWSNQSNCSALRVGSAHSGSYAFSIYTTDGSNGFCFGQIPVTFTIGKNYQASFWTRSDSGSTLWRLCNGGWETTSLYNSTSWEYKTLVFQATSTSKNLCGHGYLNNRNYLDDVEIRELQ